MSRKRPLLLVVYQDTDGQWRWRAVAQNSKTVADGAEGYRSKGNALRAARSFTNQMANVAIEVHDGT